MSKLLTLLLVIMCAVAGVSAQSENDLKRQLEGRYVTVKIDMPATRDGVNIYPERAQPLDYGDYAIQEISYRELRARSTRPGVIQLGPPTTYLKEGLSTEEVLRVLGQPSAVSERHENGIVVTTYEFIRGEGRVVVAEFVEGILVHSKTETRLLSRPAETGSE